MHFHPLKNWAVSVVTLENDKNKWVRFNENFETSHPLRLWGEGIWNIRFARTHTAHKQQLEIVNQFISE